MRKIYLVWVAFLLIVGSFGCKKVSKEDTKSLESNKRINTALHREYSSENYLTFQSKTEFDSILEDLSFKNRSERLAWEESFDDGFKSMITIMEEHISADSLYYSGLDSTIALAADQLHCPE